MHTSEKEEIIRTIEKAETKAKDLQRGLDHMKAHFLNRGITLVDGIGPILNGVDDVLKGLADLKAEASQIRTDVEPTA